MLGEIAATDFVCALSRYRKVAYASLGLPASQFIVQFLSTKEILNGHQHSRDNRSGSTGSGKLITHGQIALVD